MKNTTKMGKSGCKLFAHIFVKCKSNEGECKQGNCEDCKEILN